MIPPWGKYLYKHLPMGVANSPDISQQKMIDIFHGFEFVFAYIDDFLIWTRTDRKDCAQNLELMINKLKEKKT